MRQFYAKTTVTPQQFQQNYDQGNLRAPKNSFKNNTITTDSGITMQFDYQTLDGKIEIAGRREVGVNTVFEIWGIPMTTAQFNRLTAPATTVSAIVGDPLFLVLKNLSAKDVVSTCSTDRQFRAWCNKNEDVVWRYLLQRDYPTRSVPTTTAMQKAKPKKLYEILSGGARRFGFNNQEVIDAFNNFYDGDVFAELDDLVDELDSILIDSIDNDPRIIVRGDVIDIFNGESYANSGLYFWDGDRLLAPADDPLPENGNVPREFTFPEFDMFHFVGIFGDKVVLDRNGGIWIEQDTIDQLTANFDPNTGFTYIDYMDKRYKIGILGQDDNDEYYRRSPALMPEWQNSQGYYIFLEYNDEFSGEQLDGFNLAWLAGHPRGVRSLSRSGWQPRPEDYNTFYIIDWRVVQI